MVIEYSSKQHIRCKFWHKETRANLLEGLRGFYSRLLLLVYVVCESQIIIQQSIKMTSVYYHPFVVWIRCLQFNSSFLSIRCKNVVKGRVTLSNVIRFCAICKLFCTKPYFLVSSYQNFHRCWIWHCTLRYKMKFWDNFHILRLIEYYGKVA